MDIVVPPEELLELAAASQKPMESHRMVRLELRRLEKRFAIGVVSGHSGATKRTRYAKRREQLLIGNRQSLNIDTIEKIVCCTNAGSSKLIRRREASCNWIGSVVYLLVRRR